MLTTRPSLGDANECALVARCRLYTIEPDPDRFQGPRRCVGFPSPSSLIAYVLRRARAAPKRPPTQERCTGGAPCGRIRRASALPTGRSLERCGGSLMLLRQTSSLRVPGRGPSHCRCGGKGARPSRLLLSAKSRSLRAGVSHARSGRAPRVSDDGARAPASPWRCGSGPAHHQWLSSLGPVR
jgi:hypothetical protein